MTDHDRAAARREITDALLTALERRHEVLDLIVEADDRPSAVDGIVTLLNTSRLGAEAVIGMSFDQLTKDSRKRIAAELEDLNNLLSFTFKDRPASSGDTLALRPFSGTSDRDIFAARTEDIGAKGDGSGAPAGGLDDKVGMVFGELEGHEVHVRIWIHPDYRHRGYGTAALAKSRPELAAYFPAVPLVIRAPGATLV
jgi:GNAT superfamily N-acetyltransferase